ncbi:hypothetical protein ACFY6U_27825 [Streptomyces sp. NPDC013157]|uniref:hypothetical protein n=1 Tax=Streptomyces sp. NPDC013157 TaxID=3364861 RepID=UPI0036A7B2CC
MQSPLPRRPKGPSAIAAASASHTGPGPGSGSGSEDGSTPRQQPDDPSAPPMSAAAAAFAAESPGTPQHTAATPHARTSKARTTEAATGRPGTGPAPRPAAGTSARRRLPRAVLLTGVSVVVAALVGGAFLLGGGADGTRSSDAAPGAEPGAAGDGGAYDSTPSLLGPPPPSGSVSSSLSATPSAAPSAAATGASSRSPAKRSAKDGGTSARTQTAPSTAPAADAGQARTGSGSGDDDSCTSAAGSGALTDYSVCVASGTVTFRVTFHASQSYYHVFFDTDGSTATGYQLPYPSPSALGADYMIENGGLYRSRSTDWSWTETAAHPKRTVDGPTQTWTLPLSALGSPAGTRRIEFNAGSDYTPVITFSPK